MEERWWNFLLTSNPTLLHLTFDVLFLIFFHAYNLCFFIFIIKTQITFVVMIVESRKGIILEDGWIRHLSITHLQVIVFNDLPSYRNKIISISQQRSFTELRNMIQAIIQLIILLIKNELI